LALGVGAYRAAGRSLGEALSPFVEPAPGAALVTGGLYRRIRHPMYLGQGMIAVGAPLTLGVRWALAASAVALIVLVMRVRLEEAALRRRYAEYPRYVEGTKRFVPYLF
jgi:protein-S-isoprenylcysteine O-methyltransferase Ste14